MNTHKNIEIILLGALILDPMSYWEVEEFLDEGCFSDKDHKAVYRAIRDRASAGKSMAKSLIISSVEGDLESGDADAFISSLSYAAKREDAIPLNEYATELRDVSIRSRIKALCENIAKASQDRSLNTAQIIDRASERISELSQHNDIENESTLSSSLREVVKTSSSERTIAPSIQPCLIGLEELIGSFPSKSFTLMGGGPGSGKTALAMQQLVYSSAVYPVSLFELEMDNRSLVVRSLKENTGISITDAMSNMSPDQHSKMMDVASQFDRHQLKIVSPPRMTIDQIRSRALAHKHKYGISMLVVDHLKLIHKPSKYRVDPVQQVYDNAFALKQLAKELDCAVVALCQFTRAARGRDVNPEPRMEDFYGGAIEEHADIVLGLFNRYEWLGQNPPASNAGKVRETWDNQREVSRNRIEVYKLKNRYGSPTGRKFFHWDGSKTKFSDFDTSASQKEFF